MVPESVKEAAAIQILKSQIAHSERVHPDAVQVDKIALGTVQAIALARVGVDAYAVRVIFGSTVGSGNPEVQSAERFGAITFGGESAALEAAEARLALLSRIYGLKLRGLLS